VVFVISFNVSLYQPETVEDYFGVFIDVLLLLQLALGCLKVQLDFLEELLVDLLALSILGRLS